MLAPLFQFIAPTPLSSLSYGVAESLLVVFDDENLYGLGLITPSSLLKARAYFEKKFKTALTTRDDSKAQLFAERIKTNGSLSCCVMGTPFQHQVWQALLEIPKGKTKCYEDIAIAIGNPKALRAVGSAIGQNPISLLIPCHRVTPKSGGLGQFLWGHDFKEKLLASEGVLISN